MTKDNVLVQRHYGGNMCLPTCPQLEQRMYCYWCHFTRAALNVDQFQSTPPRGGRLVRLCRVGRGKGNSNA